MIMQHIAFIMDGNRTWAKQRFLPSFEGHRAGYVTMEKVLDWCVDAKIPYATFWGLSDDNILKRTKEELDFIFALFLRDKERFQKKAINSNIRVFHIGNRSLLPQDVVQAMHEITDATASCTGTSLIFAIGYGGQDEIVRAAIQAAATHPGMPLTREMLVDAMDTALFPPPDMIVRTGGHQRHSGFLLFQSPYAEYYFSQKNWPAFDKKEFDIILTDYEARIRKFGK